MSKYIVMLRGNTQEWKSLGASETQRLMEKYMTWVEGLKAEKRFYGGSSLTQRSRMLKVDGDKIAIVDGPYAETKEAVTGYFIIEATDHDEATEIARGCPALLHGESVEITELGT